jgi:hypothetical protein
MPIEKTSKEIYDELLDQIILLSGYITFNLADLPAIIDSSDIVGNSIQTWLEKWLTMRGYYFNKPDNSQKFPDFYLSRQFPNENMLEVKTFRKKNGPAFDIANYESYLESLSENPYRLYADYLIMSYQMDDDGKITILDIWLKKIWEIAGTSNQFPLKVQQKRNMIYNIRPNSDFKEYKKGPFKAPKDFLVALYATQLNYKGVVTADLWKNKFLKNYIKYYNKSLDF